MILREAIDHYVAWRRSPWCTIHYQCTRIVPVLQTVSPNTCAVMQ